MVDKQGQQKKGKDIAHPLGQTSVDGEGKQDGQRLVSSAAVFSFLVGDLAVTPVLTLASKVRLPAIS